jgi:DNA (cytosine-5)-methyltransferase 1
MTFLDFFSGIGGFRLGMEQAGHKCLGHCEIDKFANKSYEAMHKPKEGEYFGADIRAIQPGDLPDADCYCFGFPCQAFSIAGQRRGFEDTRGTLFFEVMRLARERQPKYLFAENVAGLLNHSRGRTFATILLGLWECGYEWQYQILNSKDFGVPQNRERVFIVGHLGKLPRPEVFPIGGTDGTIDAKFASTTIDANYSKGIDNHGARTGIMVRWQNKDVGAVLDDVSLALRVSGGTDIRKRPCVIPVLTPDRLEKRQNGRRFKELGKEMFTLTGQDRHGIAFVEPSGIYTDVSKDFAHPPLKGISRCLKSNKHDAGIFDGIKIRKLTPLECFRLQGFPDEYFYRAQAVNSDSQLYKQAGNSVTVNVINVIARKLPI